MDEVQRISKSKNRNAFLPLSERLFRRLLALYLVLIVGHFAEHVLQLIQSAVLSCRCPAR
jgi:hypothetical protein